MTCGVAKFNQLLARHLRMPLYPLSSTFAVGRHALISIKPDELSTYGAHRVRTWPDPYSLFLHSDWAKWPEMAVPILSAASAVYAANGQIAASLVRHRADVITAFCPGTMGGDGTRGGRDILLLGMAHKTSVRWWRELRRVLEVDTPDYTVILSTAVHEGSPWEPQLQQTRASLCRVFGSHARYAGFVADDGVRRLLCHVDGAALFFDPALRANHTSAWTMLQAGVPLITNLDRDSPARHDHECFDVSLLTEWPSADRLRAVRHGGRVLAETYDWQTLANLLDETNRHVATAVPLDVNLEA